MGTVKTAVIFCDDVRDEVGDKSSYMGVYGPVIGVQYAPSVLPKLIVAVLCELRGIDEAAIHCAVENDAGAADDLVLAVVRRDVPELKHADAPDRPRPPLYL